MNKTQLVDVLAERLGGDRRTAATAVDGLLETIVDTVRSGEAVSLTGFGVFEGRARAARTARNPRTGEAVPVPATTVPAFRAGATFRSAVAGTRTADPAPVEAAESEEAAAAQPAETAEPKPGKDVKSSKAAKNGKAAKEAKAAKPAKGGKRSDKGKRVKAKK